MSDQYKTLLVRFDGDVCFIQFDRPEAKNTINSELIDEFLQVLLVCQHRAKLVILEGSEEVFCFGADFQAIASDIAQNKLASPDPEPLFEVWKLLSTGSFVSVAHVRGKANAGGVGFVAACDIVIADAKAEFSLSELLFGVMPACVMPFLIRRVGYQKANMMTLMTKPVSVEEAHRWGLVDVYAENSQALLRQYLVRLKRLDKTAVRRFKRYMDNLEAFLTDAKPKALAANIEVFSDTENLKKIERYVNHGVFPWESSPQH